MDMNTIKSMMVNTSEILEESKQLEAVKEDGNAILYIHNPSEQVQIEAVKQNGESIQYFKSEWLPKDETKELTIQEIQDLLGYKVKIVE